MSTRRIDALAQKARTLRFARRAARARARTTFNCWVREPLPEQLVDALSGPRYACGAGLGAWAIAGICAAALHGTVGLALAAFTPDRSSQRAEPQQTLVLELPRLAAPPRASVVTTAQAGPKAAPTPRTPLRARAKRSARAPSDVKIAAAKARLPAEPPIVGVSFSSTVTGGAGPAYASGETLVGASAPVASRVGPRPASTAAATNGTGVRTVAAALGEGGQLVKPRRLSGAEPPYPAVYRARALEADVTVRVALDARGRVRSVELVAPATQPLFNEAALKHARAERYEPAALEGRPIAYALSFTYRFRLND